MKTITKKAVSKKRTVQAKAPGHAAVRDRSHGRDPVTVETKSEDEMLDGNKSLLLISSQREVFRNTTISPATALQYQTNIIGTIGGRLTVLDVAGEIAKEETSAFRSWARHAELTRGMHLNELLQILLLQLTHVGGDFIAVFDDGCLTHASDPTRRIKIFEADQIRNIPEADFAALYDPKKFVQIRGIVKNHIGMVCGAFVGESRGQVSFEHGEYIHLKLERPGCFDGANWVQVGTFDRANQVRGISPITHITNTIDDLAALQGTELSAAKLNAGFGLVISDKDTEKAEEYTSRDYAVARESALADGKTAEEAEQIAIAHARNARTAADKLREGQSAILTLPPNKAIDSFKTERPNLNVIELYDRLKNECGTVLGLPDMYMKLKPQGSYSAARAEMVLIRPILAKWRKDLERNFLDWLAARVLVSLGFDVVGLEFMWSWPIPEEVDEGSAQNALQKKFANCEANLIDIHGAETDDFIARRALEVKKCHEAGVLAPWEVSSSGAQLAQPGEEVNQ